MPEQDINQVVAQIAALAASAPMGTWTQAAYILATQPRVMLRILEVFELRGREVARLADELGQTKGKLDLAMKRIAQLDAAGDWNAP